jgi:hypothetical protein
VNRRGSTVRPPGTCAVGASLGGTNTSSLAFPPYNLTAASASTAVISFGLTGRTTKKPALLPPYTTGSVRISFQSRHKAGRIGGWQWRAADRKCASRCGHSSRRVSGLGVAFVGALCRRIDSQGVDPRSLNWKQQSGKSADDRSPGLPRYPQHIHIKGGDLIDPTATCCARIHRP